MKLLARLALFAGIALIISAAARGQDNPAPASPQRTQLKITLVLHEYNGKEEIATLPYELAVSAQPIMNTSCGIRIGNRIPIQTEKDKYTYLDIGTNYDCFVTAMPDGRFRIESKIDRTTIMPSDAKGPAAREQSDSLGPRIAGLRLSFDVVLRDAETSDAAMATDPLTGHVWKAEIRLKVLK